MKAGAVILVFVCIHVFAADPVEPPMPPSPIAEFRGWLKQSPEQRKIALARRSPKSREMLERKIVEYSGLPADERERRLSASEMQWYLKRLIPMSGPERERALKTVPALWQPMVMERLAQWDKMPANVRDRAATHSLVVEYLSTPANQQRAVLRSLNPQEQDLLRQRIADWKILPATQRIRMDDRLKEFFNAAPEKQAQTLSSFPVEERQIMEKTLEAFRALTREQRESCISSFATFTSRFAAMSDAARIAFIKNVERWQEMTPLERDMWREVVSTVPPMPKLPVPEPPMPGRVSGRAGDPSP